jgi:XXXCH domain-containing protein
VKEWKDSLKAIKKRLAISMKDLSKAASAGNIPEPEAVSRFVEDSKKFAEFAEPEWKEEMDEYLDHLGNLLAAVEEGRLEAVRHELRDLKNRTNACHREYK